MAESMFDWLNIPSEQAARTLLGCELISTVGNERVRVRIVEVEAYDQDDEASHTYRGRSQRNNTMFKAPGHMYVYFTYGMHHCCNIVCDDEGKGSGVLIRAVEPIEGVDIIERRRNVSGRNATNGPGKTAQALGVDLSLNGHYLANKPVKLVQKDAVLDQEVVVGSRVGISKAVHELRRFYIAGNQYVSKK